ncbi:Conserved_hypothetical protein [Hexamita inflata]|uniref:RGS domain-containing protein n=1 Tax=Hexamita inflata TaxID=28002 RepID=A0ABP1J8J2_9EUKA
MRDTFSTLGSWIDDDNPNAWFLFSIGLVLSFIIELPLVQYQYKRIVYVNKVLSVIVTTCIYLGLICFVIIACFPIVYTPITTKSNIQFADIHMAAALAGGGFFIFGYIMLFVIMIVDKCKKKNIRYRQQIFGITLTFSITVLVIFIIIALLVNLIWYIWYPILYKNDPSIGSSYGASIFTIFSFSLWENVGILFIYLFSLIFPLTLPKREDCIYPKQKESKRINPKMSDIQLFTEISQLWSALLLKYNIKSCRYICVFLEHIADYQQVDGLLEPDQISYLYIIQEVLNNDNVEQFMILLHKHKQSKSTNYFDRLSQRVYKAIVQSMK